jgi:hypothetical protein
MQLSESLLFIIIIIRLLLLLVLLQNINNLYQSHKLQFIIQFFKSTLQARKLVFIYDGLRFHLP